MSRKTLKGGKWVEGTASPKLLPQNLRTLPGELVATDTDDPDKAHELDAPHIVSSLTKDFCRKHAEPPRKTFRDKTKTLRAPGPGERGPVVQWYVDVTKMRVIKTLVDKALDEVAAGKDPDLRTPFHLWFPVNNVNEYELRRGVPPSNKHRPKHMRNIDLRVDVMDPPKSMLSELQRRGINLELDFVERLKRAKEGNRVVTLQ